MKVLKAAYGAKKQDQHSQSITLESINSTIDQTRHLNASQTNLEPAAAEYHEQDCRLGEGNEANFLFAPLYTSLNPTEEMVKRWVQILQDNLPAVDLGDLTSVHGLLSSHNQSNSI